MRLRRKLDAELWNEQLEKETRTQIRQAILKELALAEKEKKPSLSAVFDDVYAELTEEMECQKGGNAEVDRYLPSRIQYGRI